MNSILLTGGAGFVGFHVANELLKRGDKVIIIDNFNSYYDPNLKKARIKQLKHHKNLKVYKADISNYKVLSKIFQKHKFNKICHLAAQAGVRYSLKAPFRYHKYNSLGTLNLLELARKYKINDFVFASSSSVYGNNKTTPFKEIDNVDNPISLYAATKKSNELYAYAYHHLYKINCTGLRFFTVYGPWGRPDMAYFEFTNKILKNQPIDVYNFGNLKRDFTYIGDIAPAIVKAIDNPFKYEIINLGNNKPVKLNQFIETIENELKIKAKKNFLPMQKGDVHLTYADITKAKRLLNYEPKTNIEQGIKKFITWYKQYYKIQWK